MDGGEVMAYLITHSLLSSWGYAMRDNPYEDLTNDEDPWEEFLRVLHREPGKQSDAMTKGLDFEADVMRCVDGKEPKYPGAAAIADIVRGGVFQLSQNLLLPISGMPILLHGRLDALKAGVIYDIKYSGKYERGKFFDSTQHPVYLELIPEAREFTYLVSDMNSVWEETYRRDETQPIIPIIQDFLTWLEMVGLDGDYRQHWVAL